MYKLVIIDDEYLTRLGLEKSVPWSEHGIQVIGTADNGKSGLDLIMKTHPDLVITDIRMPFMSGVDLVKKLSELGFDGEIIVLTAYKDFDYAVETFNSGIFSYILKPIENKELLSTIDKAALKLTERRSTIAKKKSVEISLNNDRSNLITELCRGTISSADYKKKEKDLDFSIPESGTLIILSPDSDGDSISNKLSKGVSLLSSILDKKTKCQCFLSSNIYVFFTDSKNKMVFKWLLDFVSKSEEIDEGTFTLSSSSYSSLDDVSFNFIKCINLIHKKLLFGFTTIENENDDSISYRHYVSIQAFYKLLSENYSKPLTVGYVSSQMGVSESYLMHLLKDSLDKTFNDLVTEYRISLSKKLLKEGKFRINEIADKVGYADEKYFSRVFKKLVGCNPSEYH